MRASVLAVAASAIAMLRFASACDGSIHLGAPGSEQDGAVNDGAGPSSPADGAAGDGAAPLGACKADPDCLIVALHCATDRGACVECRADADCRSGDRPRCDMASGRCIECRGDADCSLEQRCEASTRSCVERCSASRPCSEGTCEVASGRCIECSASLACVDGDVCNGSNICVECRSDADCAAAGEEPFCDVLLGRCVRCTSSTHCPAEQRCDPGAGECRGP